MHPSGAGAGPPDCRAQKTRQVDCGLSYLLLLGAAPLMLPRSARLLAKSLPVLAFIAVLVSTADAKAVINCALSPQECLEASVLVREQREAERAMALTMPQWVIAIISVTPSICFLGLQLSGWPTIQRIQCARFLGNSVGRPRTPHLSIILRGVDNREPECSSACARHFGAA